MATILRVKRLRTQDPSEVIVVKPKKRRADDSEETTEPSLKLLKLAGTVEIQGDTENKSKAIKKILLKKSAPNFSELKETYKNRMVNSESAVEKSRAASKDASVENRYRIVNKKRAINIETLEEWPDVEEDSIKAQNEDKPLFHLIDVVSEKEEAEEMEKTGKQERISCNGVEMIREYVSSKKSEDEYGYVYDLYYTDQQGGDLDFSDSLLDELISIQPYNSGDMTFMYDQYRDDPILEEEEDSNDEGNWKNEYPDSDDDETSKNSYRDYCDDDDLDFRIRSLRVGDEDSDELSSDEEDPFLYTKTYEEDAAHHGPSYARFKQKIIKEFYEKESDDDEEDIDDFKQFMEEQK